MTKLVSMLTEPDVMGKVCVVLAGYRDQMHEMLELDPGLKSRFQRTIHIDAWAPDRCLRLFEQLAEEAVPSPLALGRGDEAGEVRRVLLNGLEQLAGRPGWVNARDVKAVFGAASERRALRLARRGRVDVRPLLSRQGSRSGARGGQRVLDRASVEEAVAMMLRSRPPQHAPGHGHARADAWPPVARDSVGASVARPQPRVGLALASAITRGGDEAEERGVMAERAEELACEEHELEVDQEPEREDGEENAFAWWSSFSREELQRVQDAGEALGFRGGAELLGLDEADRARLVAQLVQLGMEPGAAQDLFTRYEGTLEEAMAIIEREREEWARRNRRLLLRCVVCGGWHCSYMPRPWGWLEADGTRTYNGTWGRR